MSFDPRRTDWVYVRYLCSERCDSELEAVIRNDATWKIILARHFALRRMFDNHVKLLYCDCAQVIAKCEALDKCSTIQSQAALSEH